MDFGKREIVKEGLGGIEGEKTVPRMKYIRGEMN